jgi:hypothetical protein
MMNMGILCDNRIEEVLVLNTLMNMLVCRWNNEVDLLI